MKNNKIVGIVELDYEVPIEVREKLNFHSTEFAPLIYDLKSTELFIESFFLCTCNRSMLTFVLKADTVKETLSAVRFLFKKWGKIAIKEEYLSIYLGEDALNKLMRLATGCDSAMLGEEQILSQIKLFYSIGLKYKTTGAILNRIVQTLIHSAKKIRKENDLSSGNVSIPGVVTKEIRRISETSGKPLNILMVGWGPMSYTIFKILRSFTVGHSIYISNRSLDKIHVEAPKVPIKDIQYLVKHYDVIISMTSRIGYVVKSNMLESDGRQRTFFDLGVPRNIDPDISRVGLTRIVNIDDLSRLSTLAVQARKSLVGMVQMTDEFLSFQRKMLIFVKNFDANIAKHASVEYMLRNYVANNLENISALNPIKRRQIVNSVNKRLYRELYGQ